MKWEKRYIAPPALIFLFIASGFLLYYPVLGNSFLSDDYDSLYRIYIEKRILYREFLRPMIDISFYFNYLISGLSPWSFYVFNVAIHIINALLLFRFARGMQLFEEQDQLLFGIISALLFLIYPFHNESIAWLSARLSSMACFFALLALIISRERSGWISVFMSILCYLLGLLCYESILLLPVLIMVLNRHKYSAIKKIISYSVAWVVAACAYLLIRFILSGEITGNYAGRIADSHFSHKIMNAGKVLGRLFFPPSESQWLLTGLTAMLVAALLVLHYYLFKGRIRKGEASVHYRAVAICLAISLLVPVAFGISTRSSEGDRLLYFPSCFLCLLAGSWLVALCRKPWSRGLVWGMSAFYCLWFLEANNLLWIRASRAAQNIMSVIGQNRQHDIFFINMPAEIDGAFVFRNGFSRAMAINGIDERRMHVFNYLERPDYIRAGSIITPVAVNGGLTIFPGIRIYMAGEDQLNISDAANNLSAAVEKKRTLLYYWNKERIVKLF